MSKVRIMAIIYFYVIGMILAATGEIIIGMVPIIVSMLILELAPSNNVSYFYEYENEEDVFEEEMDEPINLDVCFTNPMDMGSVEESVIEDLRELNVKITLSDIGSAINNFKERQR